MEARMDCGHCVGGCVGDGCAVCRFYRGFDFGGCVNG